MRAIQYSTNKKLFNYFLTIIIFCFAACKGKTSSINKPATMQNIHLLFRIHEDVNSKFYTQLNIASKNEKLIRSFQLILKDNFEKDGKEKIGNLNKLKSELETYKKRLQNAQILMLDGELSPNDYQEIKLRIQPEVERLTKEVVFLEHHDPEESNIIEFGFLYLRNLDKVFQASTLEEKSAIIGLTYPEKMSFLDGAFQTISGTDIISLLCRTGKGFSQQKGKPQKNFCGLSQEVTPSGFKPETF